MANTVVWTDIPALDVDRAIGFYSAVLGAELQRMEYEGSVFALLPNSDTGTSGSIFLADKMRPSDQGPLVYLNCEGRLDEAEAAVTSAGGKILQPKHAIGPHGFRVVFLDTEGNKLALHSM